MLILAGCSHGNEQNTISVSRRVEPGQYGIAMVTDSGNISDRSFNQTTYEACRSFASANNIKFTAKKPSEDSNEAREEMVRLAIKEGYNIIVLPGYSFANAIVSCSYDYPDVKFIALDVSKADILEAVLKDNYVADKDYDMSKYYNTANCYLVTYKEEQAGFMAGYAAVMMGYRKFGFMGGVAVPSVMRYGYGFIRGIDAAAAEKEITDEIEVIYKCSGTFAPNALITSDCMDWYKHGTEVIFSCGGAIYSSVAEAAFKFDRKVIGVDVDQKEMIDQYGEGLTITSATKGLKPSVTKALNSIIIDNNWENKAGRIVNLGIVSSLDLSDNYVQLADGTVWTDDFNEYHYSELVKDIMANRYDIPGDTDTVPDVSIKVDYR